MKKIKLTDLYLLFTSLTVRAFAVSLFGIFVPIYLFNLDYDIRKIALFFVIYSLFRFAATPLVAQTIARQQTRVSMSISYLCTAVFIIGLLLLPVYTWAFYIAAISMGLMQAYLYTTMHTKIVRLYEPVKGTEQISHIKILEQFAGLIGPVVGGILSTQLSINYTLAASLTLITIAWLILIFVNLNDTVSKERIAPCAPKKDLIANFSFNVSTNIDDILWPLYIALFLVSYQAVGLIVALAFSGSIITTYLTGRIGVKDKNKSLLLASTIVSSALNLVRPIANTATSISAVSLIRSTAGGVAGTSWTGIYYKNARNSEGQIKYVSAMELAGGAGGLFLWLLLLVSASLFPIQIVLTISFIIAAIANIFINLIHSEKS